MKYLRFLGTAFCFAIFGIGSFIIGVLIFPLCLIIIPQKKYRFVCTNIIHYSWQFFVWIMCTLKLIDVKLTNRNILKKLSGHIVIANHPSLLDIVLLISLIPHSTCIVKHQLSNNFFMKHIIHRIYLINDMDPITFLTKSNDLLEQGFNLIIFPEGTRTNFQEKEHKLHRGFIQLALRNQKPVLPITISLSNPILGKQQRWYQLGCHTTIYKLKTHSVLKCPKLSKATFHHFAQKYTTQIKQIFFN